MDVPRVLKPLALSASRGVIRADTPEDFVRANERIRALLKSPEVGVLREETSNFIQVETYIEGVEVAAEAIVDRGRLRVLAIFDKPDPLTGPFFEETIYVTPSRLAHETQHRNDQPLAKSFAALGLYHRQPAASRPASGREPGTAPRLPPRSLPCAGRPVG